MTILYNFASRERPEKFFKCLDNIQDMSESKEYFVVAKLDEDDPFAEQYKQRIDEYPELTVRWGSSLNKVHAINRGLSGLLDYDILMNHSDDMYFIKYGFDSEVRDAFEDWDGLVHFPDQKAGSALITYAMMHKNYYESNGYVYHPAFESVYADNFQQLQAKKINKYKFVNKNILEHRHAIWGLDVKDSLLERTENPITYEKDRQTFERLKITL